MDQNTKFNLKTGLQRYSGALEELERDRKWDTLQMGYLAPASNS